MANTLADVRKEFVKISRRYDLLVSGDLSTNTDNGANYFINLAQRWLDRRTKRRNRLKKYVKVLAVGDFTFTIPEFSWFDALRMVFVDGEVELTSKEMTIQAFRDTYPRPYTDWINGQPSAWAINVDVMSHEIQHSIPQSALSQTDTRVIVPPLEMLRNPSFDDALDNAAAVAGYGTASTDHFFTHDAEYWDIDDGTGDATFYNPTSNLIDVNGTYADGATIIRQDVSNMLTYPDLSSTYSVSVVVSGYVSGALNIGLGDVANTTDIVADGTYTWELTPTTFATSNKTDFRIMSGTAAAVDLQIDSVSLKRINVQSTTPATESLPEDDVQQRPSIIFYPPCDEATTAEFYAHFYTPNLAIDTEKSYWTIHHEDLLAMAAALQAEKRLGSRARIEYFLSAMEVDLAFIDQEEIQWEMDGWDTRDYMGRLGR